jgi:Fibronectin type III domain
MTMDRCVAQRPSLIGLLFVLWIAGCHNGDEAKDTSPPAAPVSPGSVAPGFALQGVPPTSVIAGTPYSFTPTVSGSSTRIMFSITGQPAWASFNTSTGSLSGVPSAKDEGTTGYITISASNSTASASLTPFAIEVNASNAGSTTLSWTAPTENTDGSPVTDLAGYYVHYGTSPDELTNTITVADATSTTCIISGLTEGTYYFAVVAYTAAGTKSGESNVASQTI